MTDEPSSAADLYALAPEDFVAARNALVKRVRAAGDKDEAKRIAGLRRPSPGAWALNRVARDDAPTVEAALAAGEQLRAASEEEGGDLRGATTAERAAMNVVMDAIVDLLGERADANRLDVTSTIRAAAHDDDLAAEIRAGTLTELRGSSGFGFDAAFTAPPKPRAPKPAPIEESPEQDDEEAAAAEARRLEEERLAEEARLETEREARLAELRAEAERLEAVAQDLDAAATAAEASARDARAAADAAAAEASAARQAVDEA